MKINTILLFITSIIINPTSALGADSLPAVIESDFTLIVKSSAKTIKPTIDKIDRSGDLKSRKFLEEWKSKNLWYIKGKKIIVNVSSEKENLLEVRDIVTGLNLGFYDKGDLKRIRPNSGVRALINSSLVKYNLLSENLEERRETIGIMSRQLKPEYIKLIEQAIQTETDFALLEELNKLLTFLIIKFSDNTDKRVTAIRSLSGDLSLDVRAILNPLLKSSIVVSKTELSRQNQNIARKIIPGVSGVQVDGTRRESGFKGNAVELTINQAYKILEKSGFVRRDITDEDKKKYLAQNIVSGEVGGISVKDLGTSRKREEAYNELIKVGLADADITEVEKKASVEKFYFYGIYDEQSNIIVSEAKDVLASINRTVSISSFADLLLDGLSLASIFFLAAIGLAITFGVMGVINMAHGEFITIGAYTGYLVQLYVANYTLSLLLAFPLAFAITFLSGVLMERFLIRRLYARPLETLLATFGISIALQQIFKNIFGTQARPLTSPDWLDGSVVFNEIISISSIRIAIFFLSIIFLGILLIILNRTRFGLETRAVTQNSRMASAMGIDVNRINMLTFGLGSGIAGIAGVAIGLYAKVTSELGTDYIVQSFMTVVVGGVGNIWGTLAGASLIGFLQKIIEWMNPSNTLAAQTYMIIFIIIFIQFRPRGIISLKGRAAGD